jgi:hypothetical protein
MNSCTPPDDVVVGEVFTKAPKKAKEKRKEIIAMKNLQAEMEQGQLVGQPGEVVEAILLFLQLRDLANLSLTCRHLHALVFDNRFPSPFHENKCTQTTE